MKVLLRKYLCCPGVQGLPGLLPADDDRHGVHRVPALCLPHHCRFNFLTLLSPTPTSTQPVGNLEKTVFGNNFQTKLGEVRSVNQRLQPAQNFWVYSEFLSFFFVLYSRILADFLSLLGKWVKLIKFEAENEFFLHLEGWKTTKYHIYTLILQCSCH